VRLVMCPPLSQAASRFDGTWRGTYNSLHYENPPQAGDDLEQKNEFELRLHERKGIVTGEFTWLTSSSRGAPQGLPRESSPLSILNGKIFDDRACFGVVNKYGDMRWCVFVHGNTLTGSWSGGPHIGGCRCRSSLLRRQWKQDRAVATQCPSPKNRSTSIAAMHPAPAAVIACR
jgi:hypothetical protein